MRLGIALPRAEDGGQPLGARTLADAAARIESIGFQSAWVFDSIGRGSLLPDPLVALSVAATATRTLELATGVLQVPLRRPVELAHRALTTHLVSGGRFIFGVGAGSTAADFAAVGVDFASRFRQLDESLSIMRRLWKGERVGEAELGQPWPAAAGGPPVLIGSWAGSRWIERAAREFDGWVSSGARSSWRLIREGIARFRGYGGRRAILTNVAVRLDATLPSSDKPDDPFDLVCPPSVAKERLGIIRDLGFDDIALVTNHYATTHLEQIRSLL